MVKKDYEPPSEAHRRHTIKKDYELSPSEAHRRHEEYAKLVSQFFRSICRAAPITCEVSLQLTSTDVEQEIPGYLVMDILREYHSALTAIQDFYLQLGILAASEFAYPGIAENLQISTNTFYKKISAFPKEANFLHEQP